MLCKHSLALFQMLVSILPEIIELIQITIVVKMAGVTDHISPILLWGMNTGGKVKLIQMLRYLPDLAGCFCLCVLYSCIQFGAINMAKLMDGPTHFV